MSSSRDFGVEQFFRADEFRAVDPSPLALTKYRVETTQLNQFGHRRHRDTDKISRMITIYPLKITSTYFGLCQSESLC